MLNDEQKRRTTLVILGWLFFAGLCPDNLLGQNERTGKSWTRWENDHKIIYLMGFYAGMRADGTIFQQAERDHPIDKPIQREPVSIDRYKAERKEYYSRHLKYDFKLIKELLDVFYTDPDNLEIPVPEAIRIIALRSEDQLERANFILLRERRKAMEGK
ncbi:hypothetical protein ACFL45_06785 [Candidatus Neomarinimicrobiota bacterium]